MLTRAYHHALNSSTIAPGEPVLDIVDIGLGTGVRIGELLAIRWQDIDLEAAQPTVTITGTLKTLKRFKDEVKEVISGQECGMAFERYEDIRPNDVIEIFERESITRTLA